MQVLYKLTTDVYLVSELCFLIWLLHYVYQQFTRKVRSTWFTKIMSALLLVTSFISAFDAAAMVRVFNKSTLEEYEKGNSNLAQRLILDNCSLGFFLLETISMFSLQCAACLLGLKYKMTAHKITIAVREHTIVKRATYRQIVQRFAIVFGFCLLYSIFEIIVTIGVQVKDWPEFLYQIGAGLAFVFIFILFIAFLQSFREMRDALKLHTCSETVSMKVQVYYLVFLTFIAFFTLIMSIVNLYSFWNQVFGNCNVFCRIIGQLLIMVQLTQFSQRIVVKTHYGLEGEVIMTGINAQTNEEIFCVKIKSPTRQKEIHLLNGSVTMEEPIIDQDPEFLQSQRTLRELDQEAWMVACTFLARSPTSYNQNHLSPKNHSNPQEEPNYVDDRDFEMNEKFDENPE